MSVLIRGMEMPKRGHTVTIAIVGSGKAHVEYYDCRPHVEETIEYAAVPIPPHGRLIDAKYVRDTIIQEWMDKADDSHMYKRGMEDAYEVIRNAPTVIPAEEGE